MMRQMRTQSEGQKHTDTQLSLTLNFYPVIYYSTCNKFMYKIYMFIHFINCMLYKICSNLNKFRVESTLADPGSQIL
jgi:hypothetical protein